MDTKRVVVFVKKQLVRKLSMETILFIRTKFAGCSTVEPQLPRDSIVGPLKIVWIIKKNEPFS